MSDFISFAHAHNVNINPHKLEPSDKIKRCGTIDKPRSDNGAYFWDGERGWVMDWSGDARVIWYKNQNQKPWTDEERRMWVSRRLQAAEDQSRKHDNAAFRSSMVLKSAKMEKHQYLAVKGFPEEKGLVLDSELLIPMRNVRTGSLQGCQRIFWDADAKRWDKKMMTGMQAKNAVHWMGTPTNEEKWLVEGYATGLSVRNAIRRCGLPASVVVCFSASNMIQVADQIPGRKFIFADNDESKTGEKSAIQTGLPWCMSDVVGEDANDMHKERGLMPVMMKIMECRKKSVVI